MARRTKKGPKQVEALKHDEAKRKNIPTAELQSAAQRAEEINPFKPVTYLRNDPLPKRETRPRDEDLDPQIIWKGATLRLNRDQIAQLRSEEHTSELQSLMRISYAVFCLKKKSKHKIIKV